MSSLWPRVSASVRIDNPGSDQHSDRSTETPAQTPTLMLLAAPHSDNAIATFSALPTRARAGDSIERRRFHL
jgi:hypothetical protein